jgi:hypothetical protein
VTSGPAFADLVQAGVSAADTAQGRSVMRIGRIKGTAIGEVVSDVRRLLESGRVVQEALEARLEPIDLELLDAKIQPALWYENACHERLTELLRDIEGDGRDEYVVQRGSATADRLLESGLYQQLQLAAGEGAVADDPPALRRAIRLLLSLSGAMYDFGSWKLRRDDDPSSDITIDVFDAEPLTEMNRLTAEGFIRRIAQRLQRRPPQVESDRVSPDHVVYRIIIARD